MKLMFLGVGAVLLATSAASAACDPDGEPYYRIGYATGERLVEMPDLQLESYVAGIADALLATPLIGVSADCENHMYRCIEGRSVPQLTAIVRKYINENPDRWHDGANALVYRALILPCVGSPW